MVNSLENIDKSKVSADRIEGLSDAIETEIGNTLTGAVSTITTSDLTADKVLVSNSNGKVVASSDALSDLVHKSGDETISGIKTFSISVSGANLYQETSKTTSGTYIDFVQKINGSRRGTLRTTYNSDDSYTVTIGCNGPDASAPSGISINRNSTETTITGITPATSDNSNKIATTAWVNNQGYLTSATDTKNTAGSTDTSSKIFLVGATSQAANPQTYSHDTAFVDTNGRLNSAAPATSANDTTVATTKWVKDQGYTSNAGTITGITMNGASMGTSGVVDLGTVLTEHQSLTNYVTTNTTQTISKTKTFTDSQIISGAAKVLKIKNTNITRNSTTTANNAIYINGLDNADKNLWGIYGTWSAAKQSQVQLIAYKGTTTDNTWAGIGVGYDSSGNVFTNAPTPSTTDNSTKIATTAYVKSNLTALLPIGTIISFAGSSTPSGFLKCDGSAVSRTTYSSLYSAIGTTYGTGDGSTTFNLPNWKTVITAVSIPSTIAVYGNGKTLGLNDGSSNVGLFASSNNTYGVEAVADLFNVNKGTNWSGSWLGSDKGLGVTTSTNGSSGLIAKSNSITRTSASYRFCIKY